MGLDAKASFDLTSLVSIRKVQFYLEEVKVLLTSNEEFARQTNAETVAMVLLVKHFFREEYAALQAKTSPLKIFAFETEEGPRTLLELADRYRKPRQWESAAGKEQRRAALEEVLQRGENSEHLWLLMLLGYQIPFQGGDEERNREQKERTELHNAKIDHLVWNVLANGLSELTDEENEVGGLLHKVFYDAKKRSGRRWEAYQLDRIHGRFPKDNTTVRMGGDDALACSFRAMARAGKYAKVQTQLLEL